MRQVVRHYRPVLLLLPLLLVGTLATPTDLDYSLSRIAALQVDGIVLQGELETSSDQITYVIDVSLAVSTVVLDL